MIDTPFPFSIVLKAKLGQLLSGRDALFIPAAQLIVGSHRLGKIIRRENSPGPWTILEGTLQDLLRQGVVGGGQSGAQIEEAAEIPDPLSGGGQFVGADLFAQPCAEE